MPALFNLFLLLIATIANSAFAEGPTVIDSLAEPKSLAGIWQFQPGDDLQWAATTFDDSLWHEVTVPSSHPEGYRGFSGLAWYRLTLQFDPQSFAEQDQLNRLSVMLGNIESAYEFYAGGQLLGGKGKLPPEPLEHYTQHAVYQIPRSAISSEGELVLALRVWRTDAAFSFNSSGPYGGPFLVGSTDDLTRFATEQSLFPGMIMAILYFAIGLYHLFVARRNPSMNEFLWFGWFAITLAIYSMETSQWSFTIDIPFFWHLKIEYVALYLLPFLSIEVLTRIVRAPLDRPLKIFKTVFLLFALLVLVSPVISVFYLTLPFFQYLAAGWALYMASQLGIQAIRGSKEAAALTAVLLLVVFSLLNDIFFPGAILGVTETLPLTFALIILLMAVLMANHYTATLAKLEQSVEERTADLSQSNLKLQAANSIKEQFIANMSHELRTPMNAIVGLTNLGLKTDLTEQQQDYLTKTKASAANLLGIIDSVLDFSQLQSGEQKLSNNSFDLTDLLQELDIATTEQIAERPELHIRFETQDKIPAEIIGDRNKLATVMRNLISNAIKFSKQGQITVAARVVEKQEQRALIEFSITDTGIGISEDQQESLFEAFSQADAGFSRSYGGTGLGLTTANALVALMGGEIELHSREGEGSCFKFCLGFELPQDHSLENTASEDSLAETELDLSPIAGAEILVVDDSDINLQIASELLQQAGFRVDLAHDGQEAVKKVREKSFDCVLMDLQMPVMDGYEATEKIRADSQFDSLPILAVTANFSEEDKQRASESGMNAHIPKPIDTQLLFSSLLQWIKAGEREPIPQINAIAVDQDSDQLLALGADLPGLNVSEGLSRVGGNHRLYLNLLTDLKKQYGDTAIQLETLLADHQTDAAAQLAHKLRGIANNLGAEDVGHQCSIIERQLQEQKELPPTSIAALAESLSVLDGSLAQLLSQGSPAASAIELEPAELSALVAQLGQEISENNPAASDSCETLLSVLAADAPGRAHLLATHEALEIFDFANAQQQLSLYNESSDK